MKISNFKIIKTIKIAEIYSLTVIIAEVDVTTGLWPFTRTESKQISNNGALSWFFLDSGQDTPGWQAEMLYRAVKVKMLL